MELTLTCHPSTPSPAIERIDVRVTQRRDGLHLRYSLTGGLDVLALPASGDAQRRDHLWEHTCFEAFILSADGSYLEFNVSPQREWALYRFTGYRTGMTAVLDLPQPRIGISSCGDYFELDVVLDMPCSTGHRLGLSAVIQDKSGVKSYWALRHPPGAPDFHHLDGFVIDLGCLANDRDTTSAR